ncbi:MAG: hypothetical protein AB7F79_03795 [Steroidobacteraceae bacterium]
MTMPLQQVNLYQHTTSRGLTGFSARSSLLTLGVVLVALLAMWVYGRWQLNLLERNIANINAQREQQQALQFSTGDTNVMPTDPDQVAALLTQLQDIVTQRQRSLAILSSQLDKTIGFTPRLEALSRGHMTGVWLDHILLTNITGIASIGGGAVSVELIPRYLNGLANEKTLSGTVFNEFRIEDPKASDVQSGANDEPPSATRGYRFSASQNQPGGTAQPG